MSDSPEIKSESPQFEEINIKCDFEELEDESYIIKDEKYIENIKAEKVVVNISENYSSVYINDSAVSDFTENISDEPKCKVCSKIFPNDRQLKVHARIHVGERPHKCQICQKTFSQLIHLATHKQTHTEIEEIPPKKKRTSTEIFQCEICKVKLKTLIGYQEHIKRHWCEICKKNFHQMRNHSQTHEETIYQCDICAAKYRVFVNLQKHVKLWHSGATPYVCMYCMKSFASSEELKNHKDIEHARNRNDYDINN